MSWICTVIGVLAIAAGLVACGKLRIRENEWDKAIEEE